MQLTLVSRLGILNGIIETGNIFDPAAVFVCPYLGISDRGINTVTGDLTFGSTTMGTGLAVTTWSDPTTMSNGCLAVDSPLLTFAPASDLVPVVVVGWCIKTTAVGGTLLGYQMLPEPVTLPSDLYSISFVLRLTVDPSGRWSATVVING